MKEPITVSRCTCEKCGYQWTSRTENPFLCPRCKTAKWNEPRNDKK